MTAESESEWGTDREGATRVVGGVGAGLMQHPGGGHHTLGIDRVERVKRASMHAHTCIHIHTHTYIHTHTHTHTKREIIINGWNFSHE